MTGIPAGGAGGAGGAEGSQEQMPAEDEYGDEEGSQ